MASQSLYNLQGMLLTPAPNNPEFLATVSNNTIDAAGESVTFIGHMLLSSGPGTTKTISSSNGKIHWRPGANTFANASTNLRISIQDVGATGYEDGTPDVYADLVGGTDTITTSVINSTAMESGTKDITHGDLVAVSFELTARGGADSVIVTRTGTSAIMPYCTEDTGSGPVKRAALPLVTVEFNDGTLGWFSNDSTVWSHAVSTAFGSSSTPDEYALVFRLPFPATAIGLYARLSGVAATDDFEAILYSDPLGTPVAQRTITQDADLTGLGQSYERSITAYSLLAATDYAVAIRPTTANTLSLTQYDYGSAGHLRGATTLGTNWYLGTRTNQTGAFTPNTNILPILGVRLLAFDDGAGGGSSTPVGRALIVQNIGTY